MLSSTTNIKIAIEYLHWIQSNLDAITQTPDGVVLDVELHLGVYSFSAVDGLCDNALHGLIEYEDIVDMFLAWPECVSKTYPCGDREDFLNNRNLYHNPKRIELIKHCIKYMQDVLEKRDAQED